MQPSSSEYTLYLMYISYFSGKMQAYMRYKEIPHRCVELKWGEMVNILYPNTGLMKVPVVRTPEGQWLQDSTPMMDWFEQRFPQGAVLPADPLQNFFCRLVEDYADEWMWRPALYYRWANPEDAKALSHRFAETFLSDMPMPKAMIAFNARNRQGPLYVRGDGVTAETRTHVESVYLNTLDRLEAIFRAQPFLLGGKPSLADFGFFASMFRHFSQDPTPSKIMQVRAPAVNEWVARLWNTRQSEVRGDWAGPGTLPTGWSPILRDIGEAYLPYLHANACAWRDKQSRFDHTVQGVTYRRLPTVQYRVWCRERLQQHFNALPVDAKPQVQKVLEQHGCWAPLWADGEIPSHLHDQSQPPVCTPRSPGWFEKLQLYLTGTHWHTPGRRRA